MSFVHLINPLLKRFGLQIIRLKNESVFSQNHCPYRHVAIYDNDWND